MENAVIKVVKPGLSTSIQDLGRVGYQQFGMVVAGAMDPFALQIGNILVGNPREAAGIEVVIMGPKLKFLQDTVIAICGANLSPKLDGKAISMWHSEIVEKGQELSFGKPIDGSYAYIAVGGGITTDKLMGSRSTYVKAKIGGLTGDYLAEGDRLPAGEPKFDKAGRSLLPHLIPNYTKSKRMRVILGPDQHAFTKAGLHTFLSETYRITTKTDRMGTRLEGKAIEHAAGADIISDAILPGTVQVPASGLPIILLADRQPTGGYTRIATVISEDIPRIAQSFPGKEISFEAVSLTFAQKLYKRRERLLRMLNKIG